MNKPNYEDIATCAIDSLYAHSDNLDCAVALLRCLKDQLKSTDWPDQDESEDKWREAFYKIKSMNSQAVYALGGIQSLIGHLSISMCVSAEELLSEIGKDVDIEELKKELAK